MKDRLSIIHNLFINEKQNIARDNWWLFKRLTIVYFLCLVVYYLTVCIPQNIPAQKTAVIIATCFHALVLSVAYFVPLKYVSPAVSSISIEVFGYSIIILAAVIGIYISRDSAAILFPLMLIMMTQFYARPPLTVMTTISIESIVFLILSAVFKPVEIFWIDVLSTIVAFMIALISYWTAIFARAEATKKQYELHYLSLHDPLTGLLNRSALRQLFEQKIKNYTGSYAIAIIDLDNFKSINDNLGHLFGDSVLTCFAGAIKSIFQKENNGHVTCRFGGDEFLVFLSSADFECATRLMDEFYVEIDKIGKRLETDVTCSAGVVVCSDRECGFEPIVKRADELLYNVKRDGGGKYLILNIDC